MRRFGQVLGLRPEKVDEYKRHHAGIWPEISAAIREAGIRNYSIFCLRTGAATACICVRLRRCFVCVPA